VRLLPPGFPAWSAVFYYFTLWRERVTPDTSDTGPGPGWMRGAEALCDSRVRTGQRRAVSLGGVQRGPSARSTSRRVSDPHRSHACRRCDAAAAAGAVVEVGLLCQVP
jgi:hypothetical protein